jgi:hypothetical protein
LFRWGSISPGRARDKASHGPVSDSAVSSPGVSEQNWRVARALNCGDQPSAPVLRPTSADKVD